MYVFMGCICVQCQLTDGTVQCVGMQRWEKYVARQATVSKASECMRERERGIEIKFSEGGKDRITKLNLRRSGFGLRQTGSAVDF